MRLRLRPWMVPWRFPFFWMACAILCVLGFSGLWQALEQNWRTTAISIARSLRPLPPDPNSPDVPLCVLFASSAENYKTRLPVPGRYSDDPAVAAERLALLMAAIAACPAEARPRIIGVDMVLPLEGEAANPYLAAAMRELGNVVLSATEEPGPDLRPSITWPAGDLRASASAIGLDTFYLPPWSSTSSRARLYVPLQPKPVHGESAPWSLASVMAEKLRPGSTNQWRGLESVPIHPWSLYYPASAVEQEGTGNLLGLWPAQAAALFTSIAPPWDLGEPPTDWLARVQRTLEESGEAEIVGALVADRILLVGVGHPHDLVPTPFTSAMYASPTRQGGLPPQSPGVVLHAQALASILEGRVPWEFRSQLPFAFVVLLLLSAVTGWYLGLQKRLIVALPLASALVPAVLLADVAATGMINLWLDAGALVLPGLLFLAAGGIEQTRMLHASRGRVERWARRLMPATSACVMTAEEANERAEIGTDNKAWRTVIRTDLAGYTPMSRALDLAGRPDLMVTLLTRYFQTSVAAIESNGGELTDLTGDGLVAMFDRQDNGAEALAAVSAMRGLRDAAAEWREWGSQLLAAEGLPNVKLPGIRIAIGASETTFRFVGTENQQRALFFGGAFVLAARIEAGVKRLPLPPGGDPMARCALDAATAAAIRTTGSSDTGRLHSHGVVSFQGIENPVEVFELVDGVTPRISP